MVKIIKFIVYINLEVKHTVVVIKYATVNLIDKNYLKVINKFPGT